MIIEIELNDNAQIPSQFEGLCKNRGYELEKDGNIVLLKKDLYFCFLDVDDKLMMETLDYRRAIIVGFHNNFFGGNYVLQIELWYSLEDRPEMKKKHFRSSRSKPTPLDELMELQVFKEQIDSGLKPVKVAVE